MSIFVDHNYRTSLGTGFYDRVSELKELDSLIRSNRVMIVYGPRNVGKSELTRYWIHKRRLATVRINARLLRARNLLESMDIGYVETQSMDSIKTLAQEILTRLGVRAGIMDIVLGIVLKVAKAIKGNRLLIFIDEFHELPKYKSEHPRSKYEVALEDLRSLAASLSKDNAFENVNLLLTVSEGFIATDFARSELEGYSVEWMLVKHIDETHFKALYREYSKRKECNLSEDEILRLVGGSPGHLSELCPLDKNGLTRRLRVWIQEVETALSQARNILSREMGKEMSPLEIIANVSKLMEKPVKPLKDPISYRLGQVLTTYNIVYPEWSEEGIHYRPQYPIYKIILDIALEKNVSSLLELNVNEVYKKALELKD